MAGFLRPNLREHAHAVDYVAGNEADTLAHRRVPERRGGTSERLTPDFRNFGRVLGVEPYATDAKGKAMNEYLDPRPDPTREREQRNRWREGMNESEAGYFGPIIAVVVALLIGVMVFSNWGSAPTQNTQVGQNVERSQTPDTPRDPNKSQ
jgi:hypothetical protein